ncbi:MAG TPA: 2-dehydropantoate 2-reductase [Patescibacteria group bacterium]|nr:2-dehydropantoate 2-reductase [Patescibacteria group bacterium]
MDSNSSQSAASPAGSGWPRVAVIGAGAVGCYFGGRLVRAGCPVTFIGRPGPNSGVAALAREGLYFDSPEFQENLRLETATDPAAASSADVVLICVKTLDTATAATTLAPHLRSGAIVVSLQNGVENAEGIRKALCDAGRTPLPPVLASVVYVAAAMPEPGHLKHSGRGDLVIGTGGDDSLAPAVERIAQLFTRAGVPCRISENIHGELWLKLVWNCAGNAVSALGRASYALAGSLEPVRRVMAAAAEEVAAVARAAGIRLPDTDWMAMGFKLASSLGPATSSTAQDVERGRATEIDSLNGFVARRGATLGVPTPVNQTLWALVKLLEASNQAR